ncbi:MAG: sigma-70 family RNA polymerase sigma factor [Gemmatimonadaceae bacterium]
MKERADWTAGIRDRDTATLEAVMRHCLPGLLRAARAAGLAEDRAEDAVQSAVLVFVRRAEEFDGRAQASAWIHGILARTIQEQRRSRSRDDGREDIDEVMEARFDMQGSWVRPPRGPAEELALGELNDALNACLNHLPDRQRQAFALREVEGFDTDEVCKILDVSANNLGVLLYRARNRLRECLENKGMEGSNDAHM